jgi:hypothetical protein
MWDPTRIRLFQREIVKSGRTVMHSAALLDKGESKLQFHSCYKCSIKLSSLTDMKHSYTFCVKLVVSGIDFMMANIS